MNAIIWTIFEILINVFQGFVFCFYSYKYLENGNLKTFLRGSGSFYSLLLAGTITLFNYIFIFEHVLALIYVLIIFIYANRKLKGTIIVKLFSSVLPILIMAVSSAFTTNFISTLSNKPLEEIASGNSLPRFILLISTQLVIVYLSVFSLKILRNDGENRLNVREWALILLVFLISIVVSSFLNFIVLNNNLKSNQYVVFSFLGILVINIIVVFIIVDLSKMNKLKYENELLKIKQEYSHQYASDSNTEYEIIRKLRHDFKDNWAAAYELIAQDKKREALNFINQYIDELSEKDTLINTNNEIVNAIINVKLSAAKSYGINVICMCASDFSGISDLDLCSLLSNMLENAITACKSCKKPSKRIYVNITSDEFKYEFCIKNTIEKSVLQNNPKLITTKENKKNHGLGMKIIRSIADKYYGKFDCYEDNDEFCCYVMLKR